MKRLLSFLSSFVILLALVLTSCGGSAQSTQDQHVTLRYAIWEATQAPAMNQIIQAFKKTHSNIDVKLEVTPYNDYFTKLETGVAGGSAPDVFWLNAANLIKFASNDALLPLDDQISKDKIDLNNYPSQLVSLYTYNGKHYGMPKDFDTIGLWYNKAMFDAAGVKHPDNTWTWDTVKQAAQKLTNPAKGVWGIAAPLNDHLGFYNTIPQSGGYIISPDKKKSGFDQSTGIDGLQYIYSLIQSKVSPSAQQMTDTPPVSMFESGKIAMMYAGSWQTLELAHNEYTKDKVDVAVLPQGKQRATVIHGLGNVISAGTKNAQAAWEFDKFLGSKDAAEIQAKTGTVIPAYNGLQSIWVKSLPQYHLQAYIDELPYAVPYPISKNTDAWVNAQDKVLGQVWTGSLTVDAGARQLGQQMNQLLAKE